MKRTTALRGRSALISVPSVRPLGKGARQATNVDVTKLVFRDVRSSIM